MLGKINILVHGSIEEDADDYMGAIIEDYNEAEGILHLFVDPDEIEAGYLCEVDNLETEAWGVITRSEILSINVVDCSWKGHHIINDEDVCYLLAEIGDETTWH